MQATQVCRRFYEALSPSENLSVSEWAEKYRVLCRESSAIPGKWRNAMTPYLKEIMDSANSGVKEIIVMSSSQVGKSEALLNILGSVIDLDPCSILFLQPTIAMAEEFSKDRISPMIRECQRLATKVSSPKSKNESNTILHKSFPGGKLVISGSNSPASLATRPIRILIVDEVDRMEVTAEGDPIALAEKRTITFYNRLVIKVSTPTIKDVSRIERAFNRSDKRYFYVPCPYCNREQILRWKQVKWDRDKDEKHLPETARYACEHCDARWNDGERYQAVQQGKWRATEKSQIAGFHINELYSLFRKLSEIVQDFLDKKDNPETMQVWINTTLGEPYSIKTITVPWQNLFARRENYEIGTIPRGGIFLTGGADVQEDRIHVEIVAWGRNFETWSIEYIILFGDTAQEEVWKQLDNIVQKTWTLADKNKIGLSRFCIDAGYNTNFVHNFTRRYPANRVFPVIGRDNQKSILSVPILMETKNDKVRRRGLKSYPIGSSIIKQEIYGFLRQSSPQPGQGFPFGFCHFPQYPESFFQELTAEDFVKTIRKGYAVYEWRKSRPRNEALDCRVYARAAACLMGIDRFSEDDWSRLEKEHPSAIQKLIATRSEIERETAEDSIWKEE